MKMTGYWEYGPKRQWKSMCGGRLEDKGWVHFATVSDFKPYHPMSSIVVWSYLADPK